MKIGMQKRSIAAAAIAAAIAFGSIGAASAQRVEDAASYRIDPEQVHAPTTAFGSFDPVAHLETATPTAFTPDGEVEIPYGDLLAELLTGLLGLAGLLAAWLLRRVPAGIAAMLDQFAGAMGQGRVNELLEKAVGYGINTTAGAVRGKTLKVEVGNEVAERAFEYALRHAPRLIQWLGGVSALREMIIARLDLEEAASVPSPRPPAENLVSAAKPAPASAPQA